MSVCICMCVHICIHRHTDIFWWICLGNDLWKFYMSSSLCLSLKKMKVTCTWGTLHYRLNSSLFIIEHSIGVLFKTPAQVELQQGLVCWQQWMRLMRCCVSVCVFWSACTFMYEDWLARNRVLLPSKLFLCLGFIYTRKTRPLTWPNRFVCRPFWLCVCVLHCHPSVGSSWHLWVN